MSRHQSNTMMTRAGCLFLFATIQVIASQGPPGEPPGGFPNHKCAGPPPGVKNPQECCKVQPMYTDEELSECGFQKFEDGGQQRHGPPDCSKPECLLSKKGFLNDDKSFNYVAMKGFMDDWVRSNPDFEEPVETVKAVCMGENGPPGPPQICEANRLMFCTGTILFTECPTWQDTEDCRKLKEHMAECRAPRFPPN